MRRFAPARAERYDAPQQFAQRSINPAIAHLVDLASGDVVQLVRTLPCHGRGRGFESRRPRHSFQSS